MKTLKFMLAAATAIGLASAYAEPEAGASTTFESLAVDTPVVTGLTDAGGSSGLSYFYYAGATDADNESMIVSGSPEFTPRPRGATGERSKILQVSTGTDPLLRAFTSFASGAPISSAFTTDVYVDTLVQFTVTPYTDSVTPGDADKLMVYLKESTNEVNDVLTYTTNLVVVAGYYGDQGTLSTKEYVVQGANIQPNTWHRLTVKAIPDVLLDDQGEGVEGSKCIGFVVYLDGSDIPCQFDSRTFDLNDETSFAFFSPSKYFAELIEPSKLVISIKGMVSGESTLQAVGFAGEGKVDDLMITTLDPFVTALDFTLTWGSALTPVEYTITNTTFSLSGATSPATISVPIDYPAVTFTVANADGVQKTLSATASGSTTGIDATDTEFFWSDYLGEAVSGAYVINDLAELVLFKKGVATLGTSGETFKLGGNIDATDLGYFDGIGTASGTNGSSGLNGCTFDGAGYTISNVKFSNAKYRGFFNQVLNSTIKDLTINVVDIAQAANASAEHGYAAFAGNMKNSQMLRCVATGTIGTTAKPAMHTCGGFAVKSDGGAIFVDCTNYVNVVCSLTDNPKIGGIIGLAQGAGIALTNCWNYGDMTITVKTCENVGNGAGGLIGYGSKALTIYGGGNFGTIQSTNTTTPTDTKPVKVGTIIAMQNDAGLTVSGGVVAQADAAPAGAFANVSGLDFATVDGNVATFVDTLAAGNTYKVMNAAATATCELAAEGSTIAFDTALATPTYAITSAAGLAAPKSATVDGVTTYWVPSYAAANPWYDNPAAVVLAENLPNESAGRPSAFHGQGEGEYLGFTIGTNPQEFFLYTVDGTNAPTQLRDVAAGDLTTPGFRGVAISKKLGIAMTLAYAETTTMYAFPLNGGDPTAVVKSADHAFDAGAFSPDGAYFFSNALKGEAANTYYVKWSVAVANGVVTLTKVGSIAATGRGRNLAYARIKGRDLVFAMADAGKVDVIDMTGDTTSSWTVNALVSDLGTHSYGTLCVSGVNTVDAQGNDATPHLTVAGSNTSNSSDVLNVYALTVPSSGTVTASRVKSFDQTALTAAGFGVPTAYGNTVYVTDDEKTIYFARGDQKLYAAQYAEPAQTGEEIEPGQMSAATYDTLADAQAALANVEIVAADDIATNETITAAAKEAYLAKFEAKVIAITSEPVTYAVQVGLTDAAEAALQAEVNADAAEVIEDLSESTVTLTTTPGFYYSFEYGTSLSNMTEGARTLATGDTLTLPRPTTENATSGFYKVLVNIAPAPVTP